MDWAKKGMTNGANRIKSGNRCFKEKVMAREFQALRIVVLTFSDSRTLETDTSGAFLQNAVTTAGHHLIHREIIPEDLQTIIDTLNAHIDTGKTDVILCTGGTGLTGRDQTPEAFEAVIEKWIPGFGELFRWLSYKKIGASTIQSRATAGMSKGVLLFALPGSTGACKDAWNDILSKQLDIRTKPCNFAEILPRMKESPYARRKG